MEATSEGMWSSDSDSSSSNGLPLEWANCQTNSNIGISRTATCEQSPYFIQDNLDNSKVRRESCQSNVASTPNEHNLRDFFIQPEGLELSSEGPQPMVHSDDAKPQVSKPDDRDGELSDSQMNWSDRENESESEGEIRMDPIKHIFNTHLQKKRLEAKHMREIPPSVEIKQEESELMSELEGGGQSEQDEKRDSEMLSSTTVIDTGKEKVILQTHELSSSLGDTSFHIEDLNLIKPMIHIDEDTQVIMVDGKRRWKCSLCEKSYSTKHNLINHMLGHTGVKPHKCEICNKLFKQQSHLNTHLLTHKKIKPYRCDVCLRCFTQASHVKRHMATHMEKRPYVCNLCSRGFVYPSELKAHLEKHKNNKENTCHQCQEVFDTARQLKTHTQQKHKDVAELTCQECGRSFSYPSQLRDHLVKHSGARPFMCGECGMEFMKEHHLRAHQFTHTGLRPYACPQCGRAFNQKANMLRHMLVHDTDKRFECNVCHRNFTQPQTLKAHMVTHADKKPYACQVCGKEFGRLHNLQGHMHMHEETKPHICFCGASFTLKGNLNRHKKVKHGLDESCTDEEAAHILNAMSNKRFSDEHTDSDSGSPRKKRKSAPRKLATTDEHSRTSFSEDDTLNCQLSEQSCSQDDEESNLVDQSVDEGVKDE